MGQPACCTGDNDRCEEKVPSNSSRPTLSRVDDEEFHSGAQGDTVSNGQTQIGVFANQSQRSSVFVGKLQPVPEETSPAPSPCPGPSMPEQDISRGASADSVSSTSRSCSGYADLPAVAAAPSQKPQRVELRGLEAKSETMGSRSNSTAELHMGELFLDAPSSGVMHLLFETPNGKLHLASFLERPLGLDMHNAIGWPGSQDRPPEPAMVVKHVQPDSPAAQFGIEAGWLLCEVNGEDVRPLSFDVVQGILQIAAKSLRDRHVHRRRRPATPMPPISGVFAP